MSERNASIATLKAGYLFPEINRRKMAYLEKNPNADLISLGIGDTTEPLTPYIVKGLIDASEQLGTESGYKGYGANQGELNLREALSQKFYQNLVAPDEIFLSDGAKCDLGRLQLLFSPNATVAVQDPAYPVYVDTTLISGKKNLYYLPCTAENNFFPNLDEAPKVDLLFFCSPNNPTGAVSSYEELKRLVDWALKNKTLIIFDSAYSHFIRDNSLPRSIFEIEGARRCAIEVNSFSKMAGFTGVRLSWTVVPKELTFKDGTFVHPDWQRINSTFFNGPSHIPQGGALNILHDQGLSEVEQTNNYYLENARLIKLTLTKIGYIVYGGDNAPYLWIKVNKEDTSQMTSSITSWDAFHEFMEKMGLITAPGSGFGPSGEGFLRISAFGKRSTILKAIERLRRL